MESKVSNNFKIKIIEDGEPNEYILKSKDSPSKSPNNQIKDEEKSFNNTKQSEVNTNDEKCKFDISYFV